MLELGAHPEIFGGDDVFVSLLCRPTFPRLRFFAVGFAGALVDGSIGNHILGIERIAPLQNQLVCCRTESVGIAAPFLNLPQNLFIIKQGRFFEIAEHVAGHEFSVPALVMVKFIVLKSYPFKIVHC